MIRRASIFGILLPLATPALAAGGGGGLDLVKPQFGLIFWTLVTFLLLLFVLGKFAWKPLIAALDAREQGIRDNLEHAESERRAAEQLIEEHRQLVAQAKRDHADAVAAGQRDAERLKEEILAEGRAQRETLLKQAEGQIAAEMRQARQELRGIAADLAIRAAGKLLDRNVDDDTQRRLVSDYLSEIEGMAGDGSSAPS